MSRHKWFKNTGVGYKSAEGQERGKPAPKGILPTPAQPVGVVQHKNVVGYKEQTVRHAHHIIGSGEVVAVL